MTRAVFAAVLAAAVLHASWNAIAKALPDQRFVAALLSAAGLPPAAVGAAVLPAPAPGAWPYLLTSTAFSSAYLIVLTHAYRGGEFGRLYPLARGLPPLLVTAVSLGVLGEPISGGQLAGVVLLSLALTALVFAGGRPAAGSGVGLAALAGVMIAAYTVIDGLGVRESGHPLSYAAWRLLVDGIVVVTASRALFGAGLWRLDARSTGLGLLGGWLGVIGFAIVLWAQARAPLALVSAVRETSLLFAGIIGTVVFGERFSPVRSVATVAAVAGLVLVQLS